MLNNDIKLATKADIERATNLSGTSPRVFIRHNGDFQWRRPFRRKGAWCIRYYGTAALCEPQQEENGIFIFPITYWWPTP